MKIRINLCFTRDNSVSFTIYHFLRKKNAYIHTMSNEVSNTDSTCTYLMKKKERKKYTTDLLKNENFFFEGEFIGLVSSYMSVCMNV